MANQSMGYRAICLGALGLALSTKEQIWNRIMANKSPILMLIRNTVEGFFRNPSEKSSFEDRMEQLQSEMMNELVFFYLWFSMQFCESNLEKEKYLLLKKDVIRIVRSEIKILKSDTEYKTYLDRSKEYSFLHADSTRNEASNPIWRISEIVACVLDMNDQKTIIEIIGIIQSETKKSIESTKIVIALNR